MGSWQRLGMFHRVSEIQNNCFESRMEAVEGEIHCCVFCDNTMWWVKLDADGTMKKGCESMIWNP
eukprot:12350177-Ditylum_brightwellii.AAC.2